MLHLVDVIELYGFILDFIPTFYNYIIPIVDRIRADFSFLVYL